MDRRVKDVLEYVSREWRGRLSVADLAASVNLGRSRLAHLVRSNAKTSLRDLVRRHRIAEAMHLLATTHQRISEISYSVGFRDVSNFNHVFRRELGISPRDYRKRQAARSQQMGDEQP
jgi:AraC-like DNA-binding protein